MVTMTDRVNEEGSDAAEGSDPTASPSTERYRTLTDDEVTRLWADFQAGRVARCPREDGALALAVDASSKSYRLVCTRCGNASLWFESYPGGINVRGTDDTLTPGAPDE